MVGLIIPTMMPTLLMKLQVKSPPSYKQYTHKQRPKYSWHFPRGSHDQRVQISKGLTQAKMNPQWKKIDRVNQKIRTLADEKRITYININANFLNAQGELPLTNMPDLLHLSEAGYQVWGHAIKTAIN